MPLNLQRGLRFAKRGIHFSPSNTKYGGRYTVTLVPGDGIGAETSEAVKSVFKHENVPVDFEQIDVTGEVKGSEYPPAYHDAVDSLKRNKVGLKGILYTPVVRTGHPSFNVHLRKELDIFASVSLFKSIPGVKTRQDGIDFVVVRENTEGEYSGLEHKPTEDIVESLKIITEYNSERIGRFALDFAQANGRNTVTAIHKANIMKQSDGLFRNTIKRIGEEYPDITVNDMIVDNASMQAVSWPQQFNVLVTPNLYGTILSNIGAGLIGGPGLVPGVSIGREHAVFEPGCRHVGLDIQGKNSANPTAMILSSVMLLRHLGLQDNANRISDATYKVLAEGKVRTPDLGGTSKTTEFTKAILEALETV